MVKIRDDFEGVTFVYDENATAHRLQAGDNVPDWATVGEHLTVAGDTPTEADSAEGRPKGNASRDEWAAYAETIGVTFDADAKRDDIRALVDEHEKD